MQESSSTLRTWRIAVIAALVVLIAAGHMATGSRTHPDHLVHVVLRGAFLVPIILAAVWYGAIGGAVAAGVVSGFFIVHMRTTWAGQEWELTNQVLMVVVYWVCALTTGVLTDLERQARRRELRAEHRLQRDVLVSGLRALQAALTSRDAYTGEHGQHVSRLAIALAKERHLDPQRTELIGLAGLLHDVGKIGVRDDVLLKPDRLSKEEFALMQQHPAIAADLLAAVPGTRHIAEIVRAHHEFLDGSGYPLGRRGDTIPLEAQILTVADIYSAVTEERPYHERMPSAEAVAMLESWTPTKVSPEIVAALARVVAASCAGSDGSSS